MQGLEGEATETETDERKCFKEKRGKQCQMQEGGQVRQWKEPLDLATQMTTRKLVQVAWCGWMTFTILVHGDI